MGAPLLALVRPWSGKMRKIYGQWMIVAHLFANMLARHQEMLAFHGKSQELTSGELFAMENHHV